MELLGELKEKAKSGPLGCQCYGSPGGRVHKKYGSLDIVLGAKYSVLDRAVEEELLPLCRENGIVLQAYSPLEMGLLSGAPPRDYKPVGAQCNKKWFQPDNMPRVGWISLDRLEPMCRKYDCAVADLAMAWVLAQGAIR